MPTSDVRGSVEARAGGGAAGADAPALVAALASPSKEERAAAARGVSAAARDPNVVHGVAAAGGAPALVAQLVAGDGGPMVRAAAATALGNMAFAGVEAAAVVEAGAVPGLVAMLSSGGDEAEAAAGALAAIGEERPADVAVAVEQLVCVVERGGGAAVEAARALRNVAEGAVEGVDWAGPVRVLRALAAVSDGRLAEVAAEVVEAVAGDGAASRDCRFGSGPQSSVAAETGGSLERAALPELLGAGEESAAALVAPGGGAAGGTARASRDTVETGTGSAAPERPFRANLADDHDVHEEAATAREASGGALVAIGRWREAVLRLRSGGTQPTGEDAALGGGAAAAVPEVEARCLFDLLPFEMLSVVLAWLDWETLLVAAPAVCRVWRAVCRDLVPAVFEFPERVCLGDGTGDRVLALGGLLPGDHSGVDRSCHAGKERSTCRSQRERHHRKAHPRRYRSCDLPRRHRRAHRRGTRRALPRAPICQRPGLRL